MTRASCERGIIAAWSVCAVLIGAACSTQMADEVETTTPVVVRTAPATRGVIRGVVHATGVVAPAPGAELVVVAPEAARVAEIPRADGERVRRGDLLVRFEIPGSAAEVNKQQAEVRRAETGLETARAAETRARDLFDRGVAARRDVEETTRSVADAAAALEQARAALAAAETVAARATVRATFDGVVARRYHNPGDLVEPAAADPVLRLIDPDRLEVIASVPLSDASRVEVGAAARMVMAPPAAPEAVLTVKSLPTAVEPGTATVPVRLAFARPSRIPVGAPVQVDIEAEQHTGVVVIPMAAVVREGEDTAVFVVGDGAAHRRQVQLGLADGTSVEIRSGVDAADTVVVDGQAGLPDGAPVMEASVSEAQSNAAPNEAR